MMTVVLTNIAADSLIAVAGVDVDVDVETLYLFDYQQSPSINNYIFDYNIWNYKLVLNFCPPTHTIKSRITKVLMRWDGIRYEEKKMNKELTSNELMQMFDLKFGSNTITIRQ